MSFFCEEDTELSKQPIAGGSWNASFKILEALSATWDNIRLLCSLFLLCKYGSIGKHTVHKDFMD